MPFGSEQWMYSTGFYPYEIDQSLRFNDDDTAYLNRTPASTGNRKTWTWSGWVKRGNLGTQQFIFGNSQTTPISGFYFWPDDTLRYRTYNGSFENVQLFSTPVFRDASAWYHVCVAYDTTQATASNRIKFYVNGEQITSFSTATYPSQNYDGGINNATRHEIGAYDTSVALYDGYMAEVNFIDGQALDATSFGEFKSGVWIPKSYSGTYGTNGFYLDFGNSGSLGADSSGNGNNWTPNNLAATDQVLDSPTNNFATFNPLSLRYSSPSVTFAEGNLKVTTGATNNSQEAVATIGSDQKYYFEALLQTYQNNGFCGVTNVELSDVVNRTDSIFYKVNGDKIVDNSSSAYGTTYASGDIIGVAYDGTAGEITFYKNGTSQGSISGLSSTEQYRPYVHGNGTVWVTNFGQDSSFAGNKTAQGNTDANGIGDFYYAPPAGYLALCTANLPDPAIDPAQDDVPADYFNTVLYTGNGSTQSITGVGFQPDWIWLKSRSLAYDHGLVDSVRGVTKFLESNTTDAEATVTNYTTSFDSDGFSLGVNNRFNQASSTNVAWNWKAGDSAVANTDGTITSTVSANQKAGFSIFTFTGNGDGETVGHGLGVVPDVVIFKARTSANGWIVRTNVIDGTSDYLILEDTGAKVDSATTYPSSTVITAAGTSAGGTVGDNFVAYAFASVDGFSKIGTYTGNGSTDGPFIYTGFRPAWIMTKRTDAVEDWHIEDVERSTYNPAKATLWANESYAEADFANGFDILSNGFKLRDTGQAVNGSGGTYIFMAFAEMPTKYSNAR